MRMPFSTCQLGCICPSLSLYSFAPSTTQPSRLLPSKMSRNSSSAPAGAPARAARSTAAPQPPRDMAALPRWKPSVACAHDVDRPALGLRRRLVDLVIERRRDQQPTPAPPAELRLTREAQPR